MNHMIETIITLAVLTVVGEAARQVCEAGDPPSDEPDVVPSGPEVDMYGSYGRDDDDSTGSSGGERQTTLPGDWGV
jgi:hypothetical protein